MSAGHDFCLMILFHRLFISVTRIGGVTQARGPLAHGLGLVSGLPVQTWLPRSSYDLPFVRCEHHHQILSRGCTTGSVSASVPTSSSPITDSYPLAAHATEPSQGGNQTTVNNRSQPLPHEFVTLYLRGRTDGFMLKGGDATTGTLTTMYDGPRPKPWTKGRHPGKYQPMRKQGGWVRRRLTGADSNLLAPCIFDRPPGAIILATGGDNSNAARGKFYEGIMVTGNTTDATDEKVQANIVAVGYKNMGG